MSQLISSPFSECLLVTQSILNSQQPPEVEAEMLGPQCRVTQPVSDPKGAQVINLKAACRGVPEGTQSRWGMGNSPQVAGPGRGFGREVLVERREQLGHLV